jgi:hypothetical protein
LWTQATELACLLWHSNYTAIFLHLTADLSVHNRLTNRASGAMDPWQYTSELSLFLYQYLTDAQNQVLGGGDGFLTIYVVRVLFCATIIYVFILLNDCYIITRLVGTMYSFEDRIYFPE